MLNADAPDEALEATCPEHGLIALGRPMDVLQQIAHHFAADHENPPNPLVEGEHFTVGTPSLRCDLCGSLVELPWWTHTLTQRIEWAGDGDGLWLVCDSCHELLPQPRRLAARIMSQHAVNLGIAESKHHLNHVRHMLRDFVKVTDGGVREGISSQ